MDFFYYKLSIFYFQFTDLNVRKKYKNKFIFFVLFIWEKLFCFLMISCFLSYFILPLLLFHLFMLFLSDEKGSFKSHFQTLFKVDIGIYRASQFTFPLQAISNISALVCSYFFFYFLSPLPSLFHSIIKEKAFFCLFLFFFIFL